LPAVDSPSEIAQIPLEAGDLVPDRALTEGDSDEFDYEQIAGRVADLCCVAEAPINVAIFSPWGSGKSSLFTLIESRLAARRERVKMIRYDAWRYGGKALPRNFIAHAARELHLPLDDPRYSEFHRGLYENQRRVSLSPPRFWTAVRSVRFLPFIAAAIALGVAGLLLDVAPVLIGGLVSALLLVITALIEAGKVHVEQSKPSEDEEFSRRFERLVGWATDRGRENPGARKAFGRIRGRVLAGLSEAVGFHRLLLWWSGELDPQPLPAPVFDRLVFFIDELDRCDAGDIVLTLKALRTFLDARDCIFIVAADRQAIERALSEVEQSTPVEPEQPYYTAASAYLDKIFQHQLTLPPIRSRSLAKFARRLTVDGGGIWRELVEAHPAGDGATPLLDLVLFTLIPSHVRSPRRIKVLLNNYATNVRIVRSRIPDTWPSRAREVARLTAFQTEFPDFAADLPIEPRLPRFLLNATDAPASAAVSHALARWNLNPGPDDEYAENPDPGLPLSEASPEDGRDNSVHLSEKRDRLSQRRRDELRRYLERTADVEDLRRDLFYLQPAGLDVGLRNAPELAELIEVEATDSPDRVIAALDDREPADLAGAARLLASMVNDVLGPEQKQVMTALMEAVTLLGGEVAKVSQEVTGALRTYWTGAGELEERHLVGALRTSLAARNADASFSLVPRIIGDERLWADPGATVKCCG